MRKKGKPQRFDSPAGETVRHGASLMAHGHSIMRMRKDRRRMIATAGLAAGFVASCNVAYPQIPCGYEVQIIQGPFCEPFGFPPTSAKGISETGEIVGSYTACVIGPSRAFRWTEETGLVTLEIPDGFTASGAQDIDSATG